MSHPTHGTFPGILAGIAAFTAWGLVPLYWRQIRHVPAFEILAHRAIWSLLVVGLLLTLGRQWRDVLQTPRALALTALRGALVSANWFIFIWAVNAGFILETSMGYFINPLVSLLFGMLFFREKLRLPQWLAVGFAASGVLIAGMETQHGFPWIAVGIALTFACYGVLKKTAQIKPMPGLFLETAFMSPVALAWLHFLPTATEIVPLSRTSLFLIGGGVITAFPLLWFAQAAQQLRLTTIAFLQFLAPTLSFLVGVWVFHESFSGNRLLAFCFIWIGVVLFSIDAWQRSRAEAQTMPTPIVLE